MSSLWARVEPLLARVQKPARYIGCDGAILPRHDKLPNGGTVAWLLAYPDTYEIGLPNQGLQILYEILNERDDAVAERTYAPWLDLDRELRAARVPLFSVDTHRPASDFDILAFNLSSELVFTNVLEMIDLAGIPLHAAARGPHDALVIVGGHAAFNPEPLADFIDAAVLGEGEEVVSEITVLVRDWKASGRTSREGFLRELSKIPGVYVPSMYEVTYDGVDIAAIRPRFADVPATVDKRTVADLAAWPYPRNQLVPLTEVVHDRLNVEVFRGCTRGCRFCQAGMITRPVRERPADQVRTMIRDGLRRTRRVRNRRAHRQPAVAARRCLHGGPRRRGEYGSPQRPDVCAGGRIVAAASGDQQADHRGGPLRCRRLRLPAGLVADEAVLPHRTTDRDRRRHARHRPTRPQLRCDRQAPHVTGVGDPQPRRLRAQAAHAVPVVRPEHRGRVAAQGRSRTRRHTQSGRRQPQVARPGGERRRGDRQSRRPPHRSRDRARV